jgi:hypothetical protein
MSFSFYQHIISHEDNMMMRELIVSSDISAYEYLNAAGHAPPGRQNDPQNDPQSQDQSQGQGQGQGQGQSDAGGLDANQHFQQGNKKPK